MHLQPETSGAAGPVFFQNDQEKPFHEHQEQFTSLPFGQHISLSSIAGPTYLTAQSLIQQVAYTLSDKLFTYSPETFDLDVAVKTWATQKALNNHGYTPGISSMQTRAGAASIALGYMFSKDFDLSKRHIPQSLLAPSASLRHLRASLDQLSLLYGVASPFVAHIAALDYAPASAQGLVSDYASALTVAEELGLGLVSSLSAYESQHMALLATLMASVLPTVHIYDGITVSRETVRIIDVLDQQRLGKTYRTILQEHESSRKRNVPVEDKVSGLLRALNDELGTAYGLFEYHGHSTPDQVLVTFGTIEGSVATQVATALAAAGENIGVVNVRVFRPFDEVAFVESLPSTVRDIVVLGQVRDQRAVADESVHSCLYGDVLAAVTFSDKWDHSPAILDVKYPREQSWTPRSLISLIRDLGRKPAEQPRLDQTAVAETPEQHQPVEIIDPSQVQQYIFWDVDESAAVNAPSVIGQLFSKDSSSNVTVQRGYDNLVQGGIVRTDLRNSKRTVEASYPIEAANISYVGDATIFDHIDVLATLQEGGALMVRLPGWKEGDLEKRLPAGARKTILDKKIRLFVLDSQASVAVQNDTDFETYLTQIAFIKVSRDEVSESSLQKLSSINGNHELLVGLSDDLASALKQPEIPAEWADVSSDITTPVLPSDINVNSFVKATKDETEPPTFLRNWETAAKGLIFKEAYGTKSALRPDLSVKTWSVNVKENRRLTPLTYDRNIFHIEFDLGDSGLKYDIGEALGIHAENNEDEVKEFIKWYGLESEELVEVPSREDPDMLETRTVFQSLKQNIDIFGRPPKRFYEALADFASDENEKKELLSLGGPEGANEFKRRAEVDTVTYADILLDFPSAHPSFHDIVRIVNPMKRREYSVASSQKVTPTSVALMIVVVGWVDPKGRDRFGQATRYLHNLRVGDRVTVSVKPSVMKLPPQSTQPLIMAGLGTGLAPFRAFVQYRAWQKAQGLPIGAVLLYMGARHQREEYLYGEEWEAYQDAGVITLLGRAFSRDQPHKIYIQDRMRQTMPDIVRAYLEETGAFYLCGPTWPVPDVTEVLKEAVAVEGRMQRKKVDPKREIERLKDEGRYVLEVY
ncbi:MAG: hypothetical protein M1817_003210 [Caeruleum heppii]|nr:MAG: hypothetical protein M1817_003210 [Caeruleum heppii]